jgi:hypothetical protein
MQLDTLPDILHIGDDAVQTIVIILRLCHLEQFGGIIQILPDFAQPQHHILQHLALAPQRLRAFRIVPDGRVFGKLDDFG